MIDPKSATPYTKQYQIRASHKRNTANAASSVVSAMIINTNLLEMEGNERERIKGKKRYYCCYYY